MNPFQILLSLFLAIKFLIKDRLGEKPEKQSGLFHSGEFSIWSWLGCVRMCVPWMSKTLEGVIDEWIHPVYAVASHPVFTLFLDFAPRENSQFGPCKSLSAQVLI